MNPNSTIRHKTPGKFRAGDKVRLVRGWDGIICEVIEDHGHIGYGGRRLYEVLIPLEEEPHVTALGDDELILVERPLKNGKH